MADDFEGSANVEGFETIDDESTSEVSTTENINNSEGESKPEAEGQPPETPQGERQVLTDKGTKLDPNPQSAVHQELANAKREAEEYRKFMSDPKSVKRYLAELEAELGEHTGESKSDIQERAEDEEGLITDPSNIVTPEDFQSYVKFLKKDLDKAKQDLVKERDAIRNESKEKAINERLISEIDSLQSKYSFLNPKSPDFDPTLEKEIADQYEELDKDSVSGKYFGKVSIASIAERAIRIRKLGEATGSKNAQTTVLDKRAGAPRTSGGGSISSDESKMSASQLIASRMAKARR